MIAAGPERAAAGLWGDRTDAGLSWVHGFLTSIDDPAVYQRWLAADAEAALRILHQALWARTATDRRIVLERDLQFVGSLKDMGLFDEAARMLTILEPWFDAGRPERFDFLLQSAEVHRRSYEWDHAAQRLAEAAVAARPPDGAAAADVRLHVQRAALLLERGVPDLAVPEVQAAERGATDPWLRAQATFVRLRLEHALRRPERAIEVLEQFMRREVPSELADDPTWRGRSTQLRIRAALAVLADPETVSAHEHQAVAWLQAAIDDASTPLDERILARTVLITHRLDRGDLRHVEEQLAAAETELSAVTRYELQERRLALATLGLRAARCAGADRDIVRERARGLERTWQALLDRWQEQPASRTGEGPLFFGDRRRALVELLRSRPLLLGEAEAVEQVLRDIVAAQAVGSLAKELGAAAPELAEIRSSLCSPGHGALIYVPGHDVSLALTLDASTLAVHVLSVGALGIDRRRQALLLALQEVRHGGDARTLRAALQETTDVLLPPPLARSLKGWRTVTVVGLESLGYLPFELLPGPDGRRLGSSHAVTYLPSLPVGVWLARNRRGSAAGGGARARVRIVACPDAIAPASAPERPDPLPFGSAESAILRAATAGTELQILRGADATSSASFHAGSDIDLVQVLAHGIRDEARADPQGVLFGDGRILWPGDVGRGDGPRYVLLVSCRAGRGRLRRGDDGRHQLPGAALLAGARGVVAPVLDVGYRASLAFSADVHRGLWRDGLPLAEALRRARMAAEERGGAEVWDAFLFHLVGLGEAPLAGPASSTSGRPWLPPVVLAGITVAALAAWWLARRRDR